MDVVRLLVDGGADVNAVTMNGRTALMYASSEGNVDVMRLLVDGGANVNAVKEYGKTALMSASKRGNMDVVRLLVNGGADMNAVDISGKTMLMFASEGGNTDVVRLLVDSGADVNAVAKYGTTALIYASSGGKLDVVRLLVDGGADVNTVDKYGETALVFATQKGKWDVVRFLVDGGADVNVLDKNGWTVLMYASLWGKIDVVRFLVDGGANVNAVKKYGNTVLMYASEGGNMNVVRLLLDSGADVNAVDKDGKTALIYASEEGNMDVVRLLVDGGADVNAVASGGKTALLHASKNGNMDVVRLLVDGGADVNAVDKNGKTALFLAASKGHSAVRRLLASRVQVARSSVTSRSKERLEPKSQSSTSWFISPYEIELQSSRDREGVGVQFRAKWLDADVTVKVFVPSASLATFSDEVTVWRHLRHPNVIKLYGACDVGHYFFVSEFASNGSVVDHLAACRLGGIKCTPWKFLHEAALGLAYLHERKIVHGDLRGSNILIGSDGLAKLAEFSLSGSTRTSELEGTAGGVFGLRRWQSPERVEGGEATSASDVYSLGLCVVEAVSGEIPWKRWSDDDVMWRKKDWDPAYGVHSYYTPGNLSDDVADLMAQMCARDPKRRVAAPGAAQMLERLAAKEHTKHQITTQQPEPEPQVDIDEYKHGELRRLWDKMQDLMVRHTADDLQRRAFDELQTIYERLGRTCQPWKLLEQFYKLLVDVDSMARPDSYQNQIQRLSSTRATGFAMDGVRRRLDAIWATIEGSQTNCESRDRQWHEQRAKQLNVFVSEVEQTLLVLNELKTEEDRLTLLAILKKELNDSTSNYTPDQRSVIKKAYDDLVQQHDTKSNKVTTTPEWFLPWYELEIDSASCVGTGGFGGAYRARWLEAEVIVKLLDQVGSGSMSDVDSFASSFSSYWPASRATSSDPTMKEEKAKMRAMFAREVSVWFGLSHPHVVRLFGACHVGTPFFACEFAPNGSLDKYLRQHSEEIWQKLYEAALGVQYLHAREIVHGDLKCNNILVGADGKAKVTDFGLSSDAALLDKADPQVSGAWQWVAPECLEHGSSRLSSASDVYALGMCIVEALRVVELSTAMATTENEDKRVCVPLPWGDLDNGLVKHHVVQKRALPLRPQLCTDAQWTLVTRMCAFDPSDRFKIGTVVDMLGQLAGIEVPGASKTEDSPTPEIAVGCEVVSAAIAEAKSCIDATQDEGSTSLKTLGEIFGLLWKRLEHISRVLDYDSCGDVPRLWELVERARQSTKAMQEQESFDLLIEFTQTALRGYALHRDLDKLIEANLWRVDSDGGDVHDWKVCCNGFLGVVV
jgi:ankyrin repeat protein/serine/threonine protein kinase